MLRCVCWTWRLIICRMDWDGIRMEVLPSYLCRLSPHPRSFATYILLFLSSLLCVLWFFSGSGCEISGDFEIYINILKLIYVSYCANVIVIWLCPLVARFNFWFALVLGKLGELEYHLRFFGVICLCSPKGCDKMMRE